MAKAYGKEWEITISVLSFFANALLGNGSSSVKFKPSSIGSSSSNNNVRKSSNVDNRYLKDWERRKRDAEHWISVYEERLLKDPNDAATKHNLGKQRNILNNCNEQISRIKNGN